MARLTLKKFTEYHNHVKNKPIWFLCLLNDFFLTRDRWTEWSIFDIFIKYHLQLTVFLLDNWPFFLKSKKGFQQIVNGAMITKHYNFLRTTKNKT